VRGWRQDSNLRLPTKISAFVAPDFAASIDRVKREFSREGLHYHLSRPTRASRNMTLLTQADKFPLEAAFKDSRSSLVIRTMMHTSDFEEGLRVGRPIFGF
jgi:hypothetical protein